MRSEPLTHVRGDVRGESPCFLRLLVWIYFLLAVIWASTSALCTGMSASTLGQTLTTLPLGEMRKVCRLANFISL
jgi:hypothetical protein